MSINKLTMKSPAHDYWKFFHPPFIFRYFSRHQLKSFKRNQIFAFRKCKKKKARKLNYHCPILCTHGITAHLQSCTCLLWLLGIQTSTVIKAKFWAGNWGCKKAGCALENYGHSSKVCLTWRGNYKACTWLWSSSPQLILMEELHTQSLSKLEQVWVRVTYMAEGLDNWLTCSHHQGFYLNILQEGERKQ